MHHFIALLALLSILLAPTTAGPPETGGAQGMEWPELSVDPPIEKGEPAPTVGELAETGEGIVTAARNYEWALMVSGIIMLVVGVFRRFRLLSKLPARAVPWVAMVLGVLAFLGEDLAAGGALTLGRVLQGALAGMAASGAWGMIGRHLPVVGKAPAPSEPVPN